MFWYLEKLVKNSKELFQTFLTDVWSMIDSLILIRYVLMLKLFLSLGRLTKEGLQMDANKWKVIQDWPQPTNIKELQSILGLVNHLSKFIPFIIFQKASARFTQEQQ